MRPQLNRSTTETSPLRRLRTPVAAIALSAGLLGAGDVASGDVATPAPTAGAGHHGPVEDAPARSDVGTVRGRILAVDGATLTVQTGGGEQAVAVDPHAVVFVSTKGETGWTTTKAEVGDLAAGQTIFGFGSEADDGSLVLELVHAVETPMHTAAPPTPAVAPVVEEEPAPSVLPGDEAEDEAVDADDHDCDRGEVDRFRDGDDPDGEWDPERDGDSTEGVRFDGGGYSDRDGHDDGGGDRRR